MTEQKFKEKIVVEIWDRFRQKNTMEIHMVNTWKVINQLFISDFRYLCALIFEQWWPNSISSPNLSLSYGINFSDLYNNKQLRYATDVSSDHD